MNVTAQIIDPFAAGASDTVNAIPPDVYNLEWLQRVSPVFVAVVYGIAAIACVSIYARVYK